MGGAPESDVDKFIRLAADRPGSHIEGQIREQAWAGPFKLGRAPTTASHTVLGLLLLRSLSKMSYGSGSTKIISQLEKTCPAIEPVRHIRREWTCLYCGRMFNKSDHLDRHQRRRKYMPKMVAQDSKTKADGVDTGERPYKCTLCCRKYSRR
jgi:hypothetical protein